MSIKHCAWHNCNKELIGKQTRFCSLKCKSNYYVAQRRKELKRLAVEYKGGKCQRCGYNKCISALVFHHRDGKDFGIGKDGHTRSWERIQKELDKCDLLCANCHAETHETMIIKVLKS